MRALTIGELETESGVSRSTIYYYVRAGLLPPAQKSSPTRAIYTDDHVELLDEIRRLKQDGLDIRAIREQLKQRVHSASQNGEDLVARQGEETRRAILRTAAREFARNGYRQTRIADIIAELGITPQVLYSHYPTKRDLFAASYRACLEASMGVIEPRLADESDPATRLVWRMLGDYGLRALNPDLLYLARDAAYDDPETTRELRKAHEHILGNQERDLAGFRPGAGRSTASPTSSCPTACSVRSRPCACAPRGTTASPAATSCGTTSPCSSPCSPSTTAPSTWRG